MWNNSLQYHLTDTISLELNIIHSWAFQSDHQNSFYRLSGLTKLCAWVNGLILQNLIFIWSF